MRQRLGHARPALRPVRVTCRMFPLVTALPSTRSAAHRGALFAGFFGVESEEVGQCDPPSVRSIKRLVQFLLRCTFGVPHHALRQVVHSTFAAIRSRSVSMVSLI